MAQRKPAPKKAKSINPKPVKDFKPSEYVEVNSSWLQGLINEREQLLQDLEKQQAKAIENESKDFAPLPVADAAQQIINRLSGYAPQIQNTVLSLCLVELKARRSNSISQIKSHVEEYEREASRLSKDLYNQQVLFEELKGLFK